LLAQVDLLRAGMPVWQLYADPDIAPYAVVNYPPVYHIAVLLVALPLGNTLLAGRLVSLAAALAVVIALWLLARESRTGEPENRRTAMVVRFFGSSVLRFLIVLAFLALPI